LARRGGLGKGLGALIPPGGQEVAHVPAAGGGLQEIPLTAIKPSRFQPRRHFDEEALRELADSIHEVGLLQPVLVRPDGEGGYELIAGERRWRAAGRIGLQSIPALVRTTDDSAALEQALVENLHRDDLNALEEAAAYQQLIEDFHLTHEQVAESVGRSRATVTNMLRLLQLPPAIQRLLRDGRIEAGHARALLGTPDRAYQEQLAQRVTKDKLSVREVEELVREHGDAGGNGSSPKRARRGGRLRPPGLLELEEVLSEHLQTRVRVTMGSKQGKVMIQFADLEDLERIYRAMTEASTKAETG
jgi:ParB family transcriptional regulator, chromosome partitioning protein